MNSRRNRAGRWAAGIALLLLAAIGLGLTSVSGKTVPERPPEPTPAPTSAIAIPPEQPGVVVTAAVFFPPPPDPDQPTAPDNNNATQPENHIEIETERQTERELAAQGRPLLKLLESGNGPVITLEWPSNQPAIDALYQVLAKKGVQTTLMDNTGRLWSLQDPPGTNWIPNPDRYSTFLRQSDGRLATVENQLVSDIARYHGLSGYTVFRVYPRWLDARILGELFERGLYPAQGENIQANMALKRGQLSIFP